MIRTLGLLAVLLAWAPAAPAETVKIGTTPAVTFVVLYAAEHLGYFKAEGITAQFADFEGGAEVTTAMVGGSIDLAGTYVERVMVLAEKGFGSKNLLAILNRNPIFLVLRKDLPATDVKGLEPDRDVAVIAVGSSASAAAALRAGQIDGFMGGELGGAVIVHQLKIGRYFIEPLRDQGPKFLSYMTFPTLQASDRYIQANAKTVERVVRAVAKTQKRLREDPEAGVRVAQKIFPALDVELLRSIITLQRPSYIPTMTEEAIRAANQFQKQAGVVKNEYPYDKLVAVQFKPQWDQ